MLTFNQLPFTQQAVASVLAKSPEMLEFIIIDNASEDGTPDWLLQQIPQQSRLKILLDQHNVGFAHGCNQGIQLAQGQYVLVLNNDVLVTEGWLRRLLSAIEIQGADMVGPMGTRFHGLQNIAEAIDEEQLEDYAQQRSTAYQGQGRWVHRLLGTCILIKNDVFIRIGGFDPCFGLGYYEDDDFCYRAVLSGFKLWISFDVFVYHFGSKSFEKLPASQMHLLRERNKLMFIQKWGLSELPETWMLEPIAEILGQSWHPDLFVPLANRYGYVH